MTALYRSRHGSLSWCKQPAYTSGLRAATPASFQTTSAGSVGGTTAISTTLGGTTNANWVGYIVECVRATNAVNVGQRRMVASFTQSSNTLTFDEAFLAQVASGDEFKLYTTPDAPVVATSAVAGGATLIATGRTEASNYWDGTAQQGGYYLETHTADNVATSAHPLVSDFDGGTDTFTPDASYGVNIAIGDFFRCVKHVEPRGVVMLPPERQDIPRDTLVAGYGTEIGCQGPNGGGGVVELDLAGPGTYAAVPAVEEALSCALTAVESGGAVVVHTGSSPTSVTYDSGTVDVGDVYMSEEGDVFVVVADSGTAITPSPTLRSTPVDATALRVGRQYTPANTIPGALAVYSWKGSAIEDIFYGCAVSPSLEFAPRAPVKLSLELKASDHYRVVRERGWYVRVPSVDPLRTREGRLALMAASTLVELPFLAGSFDCGIEYKQLVNLSSPNETDGWDIVNVQGRGSFTTRLTSATVRLLRDAESKRSLSLMMHGGVAPGTLVAGVWAYSVCLDIPPITDAEGELEVVVPFTVHRSETGLGLGLPAYRMFIL